MSAPALHIVLELERTVPVVYVDALDEGERLRLEDWILQRPDLATLGEYVLCLIEEAA